MEKIGSVISVGTKGICEIVDIKENAFEGATKGKLYYVLKPVENSNNMQIYLPIDTSLKIRKLVSKNEAKGIIENFSSAKEVTVTSENERLKTYDEIAKSGNIESQAVLLKTLMERKEKLSRKQISGLEQKMYSNLENCVLSELSIVLEKTKDEIKEKLAL